jgi:hypothetical protein
LRGFERCRAGESVSGCPRDHAPVPPRLGVLANLVEACFSIIERQAIHRGSFRSARELNPIRTFLADVSAEWTDTLEVSGGLL